jgi:hypothetical protein
VDSVVKGKTLHISEFGRNNGRMRSNVDLTEITSWEVKKKVGGGVLEDCFSLEYNLSKR